MRPEPPSQTVQALALLLGVFVVASVVAALELLAERIDSRLGLVVESPKSTPAAAFSFVLVRFFVIDLPLGALAMLVPKVPGWWLAALLPIVIGRYVMAQGHQTSSPSTVTLGRVIYLIPEGIAFYLPLTATVAWLVLGQPHP